MLQLPQATVVGTVSTWPARRKVEMLGIPPTPATLEDRRVDFGHRAAAGHSAISVRRPRHLRICWCGSLRRNHRRKGQADISGITIYAAS